MRAMVRPAARPAFDLRQNPGKFAPAVAAVGGFRIIPALGFGPCPE